MFGFTRARLRGAVLMVAIAAATATSAAAASLQITDFARGEAAQARAAQTAFMAGEDLAVFGAGGHFGSNATITEYRTETFAGHAAWNGSTGTTNPVGTQVGSFTSLGGTGHGHSAINGGTGLEVRNDNPMKWGRHSVMTPGGKWLDSNDTYGMRWEVGGLSAFNAITFFLTDIADVGAKFSLKIGGTLFENVIGGDGRTADGTIHWVRILLPDFVSNLVVEMQNDRLNDGFGIDGMTVARIAPVPLPPAIALMLVGLAAFAGLRRRAAVAA
jgi:hypothetical protein